MIAAPKSGSGKTLITCALISALKSRGLKVASIKCGPDYIDPMFHKTVLNIESNNLDTFFTEGEDTKLLFYEFTKEKEFCVVEGVMGLFDGIGGVEKKGSAYDLAQCCNIPIVLVVDARGTSRSIIPEILGFLGYDKAGLIKGIIINNMSHMLYEKLVPLFVEEVPVPVLGCFEKCEKYRVESRHLGLKLPKEIKDLEEILQEAGKALEKTVDLKRLIDLSGFSFGELSGGLSGTNEYYLENINPLDFHGNPPTIAVARDEAFCFYYDINLKIIEKLGGILKFFSPIHDSKIPEDAKAIYFGGGYPEIYADNLSENKSMLFSVKSAIEKGIPSLAECGGFMYLHDTLKNGDKSYEMAGVIKGEVNYTGKLVRFGYVEFKEKYGHFLKSDESIKGHEFHYFDSTNNGKDVVAKKPFSKISWECNHVGCNHWWGFSHLYFPSNPEFIINFLKNINEYEK